ncbi:hypothetical protein ACROYT_G032229 [Oculina patagonica]
MESALSVQSFHSVFSLHREAMKLSILLIVLGAAVVTHVSSGDNVDTAKGLTYIGVGYNVLKGNPEGGELSMGGVDPGLLSTRRILQLTWDEAKTTVDGKYRVPNQVSFAHHESCVQQSKHQMYSGARSYQTKLKEDVQLAGGYEDATWNAAFSLSERFEQASSDTQSSKNVYFETKEVCNKGRARYQLGLAQETEWPVTREFAAAACKLPAKYDQRAYMKFIENWGTHIVLEVELGTKSTIRFESSYTEIAKYATQNLGSTVSVSGGYLGLSGALDAAFEKFKGNSEDSSKFTKLKTVITSGGPDMPAPIGLKLLPIYKAFSRSYFRKVLDSKTRCANLAGKQRNVKEFLKNYPNLKGASPPHDPDVRIPLTWPLGTYGLPMTKSGCPKGSVWHEGTIFHDTAGSNSWSNPYDLAGKVAKNDMEQKFCMKTEYKTSSNSLPWPRGQYCIFAKGYTCNTEAVSYRVMEHLGSLESTQEARVALGYRLK